MKNVFNENVRIFKAFCDENRLRILELLQTGEKCACVLLEGLNITQPTLSHHMRILCDSGIVIPCQDGKWTYYSISEEGSTYALEKLRNITYVAEEKNDSERCCP